MKTLKSLFVGAIAASLAMASCTEKAQVAASGLDPQAFDSTVNNIPVKLYQLKNSNGMEVSITNFGGRIVAINVPDRDGKDRKSVV